MDRNDFRRLNRETMTHTYHLCKNDPVLKESIKYTITNTRVIYETDELVVDSARFNGRMFVSTKRTYEAASAYRGKHVTILNFANNHSIGGSPYSAGAQEESLCRCSTLLPCLEYQEETFYIPHRVAYENREIDNFGNDDIIYSPKVTVFKTDELAPVLMNSDDWYNVDVITSAAPVLYYGSDMNRYHKEIKDRIKRILDVAYLHNKEVLILGAFGCGAFHNPPEVVASVFKELLADYDFEIVEFAVYTFGDTTNYDVFKEIIEK